LSIFRNQGVQSARRMHAEGGFCRLTAGTEMNTAVSLEARSPSKGTQEKNSRAKTGGPPDWIFIKMIGAGKHGEWVIPPDTRRDRSVRSSNLKEAAYFHGIQGSGLGTRKKGIDEEVVVKADRKTTPANREGGIHCVGCWKTSFIGEGKNTSLPSRGGTMKITNPLKNWLVINAGPYRPVEYLPGFTLLEKTSRGVSTQLAYLFSLVSSRSGGLASIITSTAIRSTNNRSSVVGVAASTVTK